MPSEHYGNVQIRDASNEVSTTSLNFGAITIISLPGLLTQWGNFKTTLGNIIKGILGKEQLVMDSTVLSNDVPVDSTAQVELKFQFSYEGNTSKKKYRFEVATPDTDKLVPGTDLVDMTDADVAAFVTAVETLAKTPDDDTEGITILSGRLVGRNR